jgi:hypothetical protein
MQRRRPCAPGGIAPKCAAQETVMRAEAEAYATQIQQALALLRRFL